VSVDVSSDLIGIPHLRDLWSRTLAQRAGGSLPARAASDAPEDRGARFDRDKTVIFGLGLGLRETLGFLYGQAPSFEAFERWIIAKNCGAVDPSVVARINAALAGAPIAPIDDGTAALAPDELAFFGEHGYVVLRGAVTREAARAAEDAIWSHLQMDRDDPQTWYRGSHGHSIWVPLIRDPALDANRASPRIAAAFAQLWKRSDLWPTVDQSGFNPPETPDWRFPGPHLHWDVSLALPIPFGLQGILYLVDTAADQGAFTCVPGFHRRIESWIGGLPPGADPRREILGNKESVAVEATAGDMIIWQHALPHGASPNRATRPRIVQYISLQPSSTEHSAIWK
jgi:hypothetical protein